MAGCACQWSCCSGWATGERFTTLGPVRRAADGRPLSRRYSTANPSVAAPAAAHTHPSRLVSVVVDSADAVVECTPAHALAMRGSQGLQRREAAAVEPFAHLQLLHADALLRAGRQAEALAVAMEVRRCKRGGALGAAAGGGGRVRARYARFLVRPPPPSRPAPVLLTYRAFLSTDGQRGPRMP